MTSLSKSCFALLFAALTVWGSGAQTTNQRRAAADLESRMSNKMIVVLPPAANCPVAMSAQHGVHGSMVTVNNARHGIGQQLELTLNNPGSTGISAIRITVNGWDGHGRTLPAAKATTDDTTASRTLELKVPIAPHTSTKTDVWVSGLTSVNSIDLVEVQYAKGLNWRARGTQACSIVPDPATLISQR